ncbi:phenylacetate--CoA ligase family protein [Dictyoglomus thermophilum]|nr:phenylacetate--CoA ligase family protein [Dictyoglomus thermophilum]
MSTRSFLFRSYYKLRGSKVLDYYDEFKKSQYLTRDELIRNQEKQLKRMIEFVYENVPYYKKLFKSLSISPDDINKVEDLQKLPILTKREIKRNWEDFFPQNLNSIRYIKGKTGGSTGEPFKYRMSLEDYERGIALLYRGWGFAGYQLGDKVAVIGGSSLVPSLRFSMKRKIQESLLNFRYYSSFDMSEENLLRYIEDMNCWNPKFIRGYASSIYLMAKFIEQNRITLSFVPKAIFSTAEKLTFKMRESIERVFKTQVFDNYGLNDGGISAYECEQHNGLHIDTERAILEVVDESGKQLKEGEGKILATSLYNFAMPLIRYDTGDIGIISSEFCKCGRASYLLKGLVGRSQEFVVSSLGSKVHGEFFTHIFWEIDNVKQFQVIQENVGEVLINIVPDDWDHIDRIDVKKITKILENKGFKVSIKLVNEESLSYTSGGKYKFVINKLSDYNES